MKISPHRNGENSCHFGETFSVLVPFCCRYGCKLMLQDEPPEGDAPQTITLTRKDVMAARRLLHLLLSAELKSSDRLGLEPPPPTIVNANRPTLIERAQDEFHNRRRRTALFGERMFGEAAWDMLLALYILDISGQRQTLGTLAQFSGTSPTTARRWLDFLAAHDLVRRVPHPTDLRTAFVSLTPHAREKLDLYYSGTVGKVV